MQVLKRIVPVVATIALLSSTAYAGIQKGYVRDANGNAIAGVHVVNTRQTDPEGKVTNHAITKDDGSYEVYAVDWSGANTFVAYHDDYTTPYRWNDFWRPDVNGVTDLNWTVKKQYLNGDVAYDSFSGSGSAIGSKTDDPNQFIWTGNNSAGVSLVDGKMVLSSGGDSTNGVSIGPNDASMPYLPSDFILNTRMRFDGGGWAIIDFRQQGAYGNYNTGNALWFAQDGRVYGSFATGGPNRVYQEAPDSTPKWSDYRDVKIKAQGYRMQVWIDGVQVADDINPEVIYETGAGIEYPQARGGYIGFFESTGTTMYFDSISVTELTPVPEPSSIVTLLAGSVGLIGFARRRRS